MVPHLLWIGLKIFRLFVLIKHWNVFHIQIGCISYRSFLGLQAKFYVLLFASPCIIILSTHYGKLSSITILFCPQEHFRIDIRCSESLQGSQFFISWVVDLEILGPWYWYPGSFVLVPWSWVLILDYAKVRKNKNTLTRPENCRKTARHFHLSLCQKWRKINNAKLRKWSTTSILATFWQFQGQISPNWKFFWKQVTFK